MHQNSQWFTQCEVLSANLPLLEILEAKSLSFFVTSTPYTEKLSSIASCWDSILDPKFCKLSRIIAHDLSAQCGIRMPRRERGLVKFGLVWQVRFQEGAKHASQSSKFRLTSLSQIGKFLLRSLKGRLVSTCYVSIYDTRTCVHILLQHRD